MSESSGSGLDSAGSDCGLLAAAVKNARCCLLSIMTLLCGGVTLHSVTELVRKLICLKLLTFSDQLLCYVCARVCVAGVYVCVCIT
jgi:hypothetical protein